MATKTCVTFIYEWYDGIEHNIKDKGCCKHFFGEADTEIRRCWYTVIYTIISFYCTGMFNVIAQKRGVMYDVEGPIADLGFDAFYALTHKLYGYNPWINDQLTEIMVIICAVWILIFMGRRRKGYQRRIVIYKRWMLIVSICFNIRCITIVSTTLPRPWNDNEEWKYCKGEYDATFSWNVALETFAYIAGHKNICYDFFFSGHTVNVTMVALLVTKYSKCIYFKIIIWLMAIFTMITIVAVRSHYTSYNMHLYHHRYKL